VEIAKDFILGRLKKGVISEKKLKQIAKKERISDYAFNSVIKEMKKEETLEAIQLSVEIIRRYSD
jgi:hypothetical protein